MAALNINPEVDDDTIPGQSDVDEAESRRAVFVFEVDDVTYRHDRPTITGAQIMTLAGISPADGLIQILPDGTRKTVESDDRVRLVPGAQFKRRPRFKRG